MGYFHGANFRVMIDIRFSWVKISFSIDIAQTPPMIINIRGIALYHKKDAAIWYYFECVIYNVATILSLYEVMTLVLLSALSLITISLL